MPGGLYLTALCLALYFSCKRCTNTSLCLSSRGDGVAVLRYFNEVYSASKELPIISDPPAPTSIKPLEFEFSDVTRQAIANAEKYLDDLIASVELKILETEVGFLLSCTVCAHGYSYGS